MGRTNPGMEELTIEKFSEDVIAFCNRKGIQQAFVIGYSDGGNIALFLAKKAPKLFPRIVAISPNTLANGTKNQEHSGCLPIHAALDGLPETPWF